MFIPICHRWGSLNMKLFSLGSLTSCSCLKSRRCARAPHGTRAMDGRLQEAKSWLFFINPLLRCLRHHKSTVHNHCSGFLKTFASALLRQISSKKIHTVSSYGWQVCIPNNTRHPHARLLHGYKSNEKYHKGYR